MGELVIHHAYNPNSGSRRLTLREGEFKPHSLRFNGKRSLGFSQVGNTVKLSRIWDMDVVGNPDGLDLSLASFDLRLRPGQQVTLRFNRGKVLHTVGVLPQKDWMAGKAIQRAKVKQI